jgi:leucyl-tRNA synthetase
MIHSGPYNGLSSEEGGRQLAADLAQKGMASPTVTYKMRDWLISRQRYWGAPIPIVHCPTCGPVAVPDDELPVVLPVMDNFEPSGDGRSPLARVEAWVQTTCPNCGCPARRETDTMDGFACSSWYFLRFASPHEMERPFDPQAVEYWMPVDNYIGGVEHAVMHLLYARVWTKVMYDAGLVSFVEPFSTLKNQGVLHAADGQRMSKSKGNVVRPDDVIAEHGTDAFRTYILFIGPFEGDVLWADTNIKGVNRFLERYWNLAQEMAGAEKEGDPAVEEAFRRQMHRFIRRITHDFEQYKFNTAVAACMEYMNDLYEQRENAVGPAVWREVLETYTRLLCPIAPFITEEIWQRVLGHTGQSVHQATWPGYDDEMTAVQEVTMMIQVNGKVRDQVHVPADIADSELETIVLARDKVQKFINGQAVQKIIVVPQRLVNVVVH